MSGQLVLDEGLLDISLVNPPRHVLLFPCIETEPKGGSSAVPLTDEF